VSAPDLPVELTDGEVVLRAWKEADLPAVIAGHDEELAHWLGRPIEAPSLAEQQAAFATRAAAQAAGRLVSYVVDRQGQVVGEVAVERLDDHRGRLSWLLYAGHRGQGYATRAVRLLVDHAFADLGLTRVEVRIDADNQRAIRIATRAGLRREGVIRVEPGTGHRPDIASYVLLARLASDAPFTEPTGFRSLLNSFLPRKRAIAQMLVRDPAGRVLTCKLTYKRDWDLPGGVVEVGESPQLAAGREVKEELAIDIAPGRLLLTDWMPPWGGWDDALCLVFDGGVVDPTVLDAAVLQAREIRSVQFGSVEELREHCADFTVRRIEAALRVLDGTGPTYTESGRP
jgi:RimJ/RimL family protein N-acetyltransferase/8-oxo-dGTP pyrophosphatase MutT (NUDIX family)